MVDEIRRRVDDWLPRDVTDQAEIEAALSDTGWSEGWDSRTLDTVADAVRDVRSPDTSIVERERIRQTTITGRQGDEGGGDRRSGRHAQVQAADGTFLGKSENVSTWTDRWGNVMAENTETGTRKKLQDSDNV